MLWSYHIIKNKTKMLDKKISLCKNMHTDDDSDFFVREASSPKLQKKKFRKWTETENQSYSQFLVENFEEFRPENHRRSMNFFKRMSEAVNNNRSNEQCRSHHQKMLKKFGTIQEIIKNLGKPEVAVEEKNNFQKSSQTVQAQNIVGFQDFQEDLKSFHPIDKNLELILMEDIGFNKQESFMNFFEPQSLGYFF